MNDMGMVFHEIIIATGVSDEGDEMWPSVIVPADATIEAVFLLVTDAINERVEEPISVETVEMMTARVPDFEEDDGGTELKVVK